MKLKFWGVRGSVPTPSTRTTYFGGNTTCLQIIRDQGPIIIIDSGTGIRELGAHLMTDPAPPFDIKLMITHTHWDHIHGFPFFKPIYIPGGHIDAYGVGPIHQGINFESVMRDQMTYSYFPVEATMVDGVVTYHDLHEMHGESPGGSGGELELCPGVTLKFMPMNHPVYCVGYRIEADGKSIVFTGDHEPYYDAFAGTDEDEDEDEDTGGFADLMNQRFEAFCKDADLLVIDSTYTEEEYFLPAFPRKGWGHGYFEWCYEIAEKAGVKRLAFTHHDPERTDDELFALEDKWREIAKERGKGVDPFCAREGFTVDLSTPVELPPRDCPVCHTKLK